MNREYLEPVAIVVFITALTLLAIFWLVTQQGAIG